MPEWGLLPADVQSLLLQKEWQSPAKLRDRLLGKRAFPLRVPLKVPTGAQALGHVQHFHEFIKQWKQWPRTYQVKWEQRQYRELGTHDTPASLTIDSMQALIEFIGPQAIARSQHWEKLMSPILAFDDRLYPVLVRHLAALEKLDEDDVNLVAALLPQLQKGLGRNCYLRALPLQDVDTKFLENHFSLVADLLDTHHEGEVSRGGGLSAWLDCEDIPKSWLLVRPLCPKAQERLHGLPLLQLSTQTLRKIPLPAANILVVENKQPGYGLPALTDTIAVFGGGANVSWMNASWLQDKNVGYWGDIDTWGLSFLSDARRLQPGLCALMMDEQTFIRFQQRAVVEPTPCEKLPPSLTAQEIELFEALQQGNHQGARLEQERLAPDYIENQLKEWGVSGCKNSLG